eukprot:TRINITY_DN1689_c0_g1_i1.p2 TRINITY_DN1689_c0_g1~~TRINITY_DN1689_c0_g1_i1.p2  ORF type:complete len:240 (+),score=29.47 TRINITY_DN1689_c0_g1_i1:546-1265(+)
MGLSFQLGPVLTLVCVLELMILFYLAHWESYHTGVLLLRPLSNPVEAQWGFILGLLLTAWNGTLWWNDLSPLGFPYKYLFSFISTLSFLATSYEHISTVVAWMGTRGGMRQPVLTLIPLLLVVAYTTLWGLFAPDLVTQHTTLFVFTMGMLFANIQIRLIVQCVTKDRAKIYYNILSPMFLILLNAILGYFFAPIFDNSFVLWCYSIVITFYTSMLVLSVVTEMCVYLKLHPFSIKSHP